MQTGKQTKMMAYLLIFVSLFILVFFVKNYYSSLLLSMDNFSIKQNEVNVKKTELSKLDEIENSLKTNSWVIKEVSKYVNEINEDELIPYFYDKARESRRWSWYLVINSIGFDKWTLNEYWFNQWTINLNVFVSDENQVFDFLDYLTWEDAKYKFFIDSFSFPNDPSSTSGFQVNLPLKIFYK